jgi:hypothetical protein
MPQRADLVTKLNDIWVNEAQLSVTVTEDEGGEKTRKARRSVSQEALRAEITKDAGALLALEAAHAALAERLVTPDRLAAMQSAGEGLAGLLADRDIASITEQEAFDMMMTSLNKMGEIDGVMTFYPPPAVERLIEKREGKW